MLDAADLGYLAACARHRRGELLGGQAGGRSRRPEPRVLRAPGGQEHRALPGDERSGLPAMKTALQTHASFFDPAGTGSVKMRQTYAGMRRLGVHIRWRVLLTPVINGFLGMLTKGPPFVIVVDRIAQGKHPYDSGSFGDDGSSTRRPSRRSSPRTARPSPPTR